MSRNSVCAGVVLAAAVICCLPGGQAFAQGRAAKAIEADRIIAVVNDEVITLNELTARMATVERQLRQQGTQMPPRDVLEKHILELVARGIVTRLAEMSRGKAKTAGLESQPA